jgi:hypothetical protein
MFEAHLNSIYSIFEDEPHIKVPLYDEFKPPIEYLTEKTYVLQENVIADLEIDTSLDISANHNSTNTMYDYLCNPNNQFMKHNILKNKKYTTDVDFLKNNQKIIKNMAHFDNSLCDICCNHFLDVWKETKENEFFLEKYCYMDWKIFKQMNNSSLFLQALSFVNLSSPIFSLILPLLFLILPFIIIKLQGVPITFSMYMKTLQQVASNHFIGKIFNLRTMDFQSLMYFLVSMFFYGMQIYQNVNLCVRFYDNINVINTHLYNMKHYVNNVIGNMEQFISKNDSLVTHNNFIGTIEHHCYTLKDLKNRLSSITPFKPSIFKLSEVGYLLKIFYILHNDVQLEKSIQYSAGFMGYIQNLKSIHSFVNDSHVNYASFSKTKTKINNQYYPPYIRSNHVKNDCTVNKMIITGPNASGKTTQLKTTALNIIFTQQYGVGFYDSCTLNPYDYIHSYLNIPDTSGRDSLFQAESRRCKEIIDIIDQNKDKRHFTIFDELFSGTNPAEATKSAYAFLKYIAEFDNVDFILTTHYTTICKKLGKSKKVQNYKMDVKFDEQNKISYTYKMKKGISKVQGALLILEDMNYPNEILDSIKNYA